MQTGPSQSSHGDFSLPSGPSFLHSSAGSPGPSHSPSQRKSWRQQSLPRISSGKSGHVSQHNLSSAGDTHERNRNTVTAATNAEPASGKKWWRIRLFRGMINDIKRRAPFYWSDWTDVWDYRVVPATIYMYFAKYGLNLILFYFFSCLLFPDMVISIFKIQW